MRLSDRGQDLVQKYNDIYNGAGFFQDDQVTADEKKIIFDGYSMYKHLWKKMTTVIDDMQSFTLLDYGCGRAKHLFNRVLPGNVTFHEHFRGKCQSYYCYDPANPLYMRKPPTVMKFDIVVCADVMEHIAEEDVPAVVQDMASYMHDNSTIFFSICGAPAVKSFADTEENFHVTLKSRDWWKAQIARHVDVKRVVLAYHA